MPVTSLGHQEGRSVFWEGPKFFELCPIVFNQVQYIFQGGEKFSRGGYKYIVWSNSKMYISQRNDCLKEQGIQEQSKLEFIMQ